MCCLGKGWIQREQQDLHELERSVDAPSVPSLQTGLAVYKGWELTNPNPRPPQEPASTPGGGGGEVTKALHTCTS